MTFFDSVSFRVALGTYKNFNEEAIFEGIKVGYRHIDTATFYENEHLVGNALARAKKELGLDREKFFLTTKIWNSCHRPDLAVRSLEQSLKNLKTDYVDLLLIHWPVAFVPSTEHPDNLLASENNKNGDPIVDSETRMTDTWKEMEKLVQKGKVKHIGISNSRIADIEAILKIATIPLFVNQIEYHPYLQQPKLIRYLKEKNIKITGYRVIGGGQSPTPLEDPIVNEIAKKEGLSPAQTLIAWALTTVNVVLVKASTERRLKENWDFLQSKGPQAPVKTLLSSDSIKALNSLWSKHVRYCDPVEYWNIPLYSDDEN